MGSFVIPARAILIALAVTGMIVLACAPKAQPPVTSAPIQITAEPCVISLTTDGETVTASSSNGAGVRLAKLPDGSYMASAN